MNEIINQTIDQLKQDVLQKASEWQSLIDNITNSLDHKNGSNFSFNSDYLKQFTQHLNQFKISPNNEQVRN
jgi:hypothetical protein